MAKKKASKKVEGPKTRTQIITRMAEMGIHVGATKIEKGSTGSLLMDFNLSGGFSRKRVTEIFGLPNSGKTTIALLAAKAAIERGEKVAFIDIETHFDPDYALMLGVDVDELDENGIPVIDIFEPATAEQALQGAYELILNSPYDLIIVDTIGAISPKAEQETEIEKRSQLGNQAFMITRFCRMVQYPLKRSNKIVLLLNQVRDKINSMYPGFTAPGGRALKHAAALRIQTIPPEEIWVNGNTKSQIAKLKIRWRMEKRKDGAFDKAEHYLVLERLTTGEFVIDEPSEIYELAVGLGIFTDDTGAPWVKTKGAWFNGKSIAKGEDKIKKAIEEDIDLFEALSDKIQSLIGTEITGQEDEKVTDETEGNLNAEDPEYLLDTSDF